MQKISLFFRGGTFIAIFAQLRFSYARALFSTFELFVFRFGEGEEREAAKKERKLL